MSCQTTSRSMLGSNYGSISRLFYIFYLQKITAAHQQKKAEVQGMLSTQVLTGIPEGWPNDALLMSIKQNIFAVDLGIDSKIKNIEETERAKADFLTLMHEKR